MGAVSVFVVVVTALALNSVKRARPYSKTPSADVIFAMASPIVYFPLTWFGLLAAA